MMKEDKCKSYEHTNDFKACALKHITTARKLLSEGNIQGAEYQLECVERHLKDM
jgi:hypothetical protein